VFHRSRKKLHQEEGGRVKSKLLVIVSSAVLLACTEKSGLEEANRKIEELQMKIVDLQTEMSHIRKTNAELNALLQRQR
jgi:hypothetical protein